MVSPISSTRANVLSRGFIAPEEVAAAERQPIAMVRSHVSWGSVIAGSIATLALLMLSSSLAYACGVPVFAGTGSYGVGAAFWSCISAIIAFGIGGWVAGLMASPLDARYRVLHGLMTWALTLPLTVLVFGGLGGALARGGLILSDVQTMVINAPRVGPAWGALIAMTLGLFAAVAGSAFVEAGTRESREYGSRQGDIRQSDIREVPRT